MQNIGLKVKALREGKQMTQLSLAQKAGIDNSLVSRIESGDTTGSLKTIQSIAAALDVPVSELLADSNMYA